MKKILFAVSLFVGCYAANAHAWVCTARSPVAYGQGVSFDIEEAQSIAMAECQIRTPYTMVCYITSCF